MKSSESLLAFKLVQRTHQPSCLLHVKMMRRRNIQLQSVLFEYCLVFIFLYLLVQIHQYITTKSFNMEIKFLVIQVLQMYSIIFYWINTISYWHLQPTLFHPRFFNCRSPFVYAHLVISLLWHWCWSLWYSYKVTLKNSQSTSKSMH